MGQAREIMDRITAAVVAGDRDALLRAYAADAVAETPEGRDLDSGEAIADHLLSFRRAFPDLTWEPKTQFESGDTAIDEGWLVGTHTGVLALPEGDVPPTGRSMRLRECDLLTVRDGAAISHRMYYDQVEVIAQLGLGQTAAAAVPEPRAAAGIEQATGAPAT
ncbi:ester cyclase [Geodermatophilus sp. SYSU D01036]